MRKRTAIESQYKYIREKQENRIARSGAHPNDLNDFLLLMIMLLDRSVFAAKAAALAFVDATKLLNFANDFLLPTTYSIHLHFLFSYGVHLCLVVV
jgi:hypothetical protein